MATDQTVSAFTDAERDYLNSQRLGRLVTLGPDGGPQARPVGFTLRGAVIEIGGFNLTATQKFRNIGRDPKVAFIVDDLASVQPWRVRGVEVRGTAQALTGDGGDPVIRVHPHRIISWGLGNGGGTNARNVAQ
jgi:pyridoxamine 5'-phosphate oxidase family protein